MNRLTQKMIDIKARKFRLIAGTLHVESRNERLPPHVRSAIAAAHDVLWDAIRDIEALPVKEG